MQTGAAVSAALWAFLPAPTVGIVAGQEFGQPGSCGLDTAPIRCL
nr:hypothetical protein [Kibdelosporangium sp. MJ126-NF4]